MADFSSLLSSLFTATSSSASTFFSRSSSPSSPTHSLSSPASRIGSPSSLMPRPSAASLRVRLMTSIALSSPLFEAPCRSLDRTSAAGASSRWVVDTPSSRRPCAYALDSVTASHLAHLAPTLPPPLPPFLTSSPAGTRRRADGAGGKTPRAWPTPGICHPADISSGGSHGSAGRCERCQRCQRRRRCSTEQLARDLGCGRGAVAHAARRAH